MDENSGPPSTTTVTQLPRASLAVRRAAHLPKLKDIRGRADSGEDCPVGMCEEEELGDLDFAYGDTDPSFGGELSDLYAYSELPEFLANVEAYGAYAKDSTPWWSLPSARRQSILGVLLDDLDSADPIIRLRSLRAILYLLQGCFRDCTTEQEVLWSGVRNAYMISEAGGLASLASVLAREAAVAEEEDERVSAERREAGTGESKEGRTGGRPNWAQPSVQVKRSSSVTIHDNEALRVVLSALGHLTESLRREGLGELGAATAIAEHEHARFRRLREEFREVLLTWLGGWETLRRGKLEKRQAANLPPQEDTLLIARNMRASAPPSIAGMPGLVVAGDRAGRPPLAKRQVACESGTSQDEEDSPAEEPGNVTPIPEQGPGAGAETPRPGSPEKSESSSASSRTGTLQRASLSVAFAKALPWAPKIRESEVEAYLENERLKFLGFQLPGDVTTTAGLPEPIQQSLKSLKKHVYVSLGEVEMKREVELNRFRFSQKEEIPETPMEQLYRHLLPEIPQHMIALLKIILSAQPSSRGKTEAMNILADVLTGEVEPGLLSNSNTSGSLSGDEGGKPGLMGGEESAQARLWAVTSLDVTRHKELIVKAAAALLLLLLKHSRLSHVYQFEHIAQHLVFANCIPLILKFFDGNILGFVQSRAELAELAFPAVVLGGPEGHGCHWPPQLPATRLEVHKDSSPPPGSYFLWRNLFSAINLLRILNKLTKWKHARTMMLVVFKAAPILKRTLKIKHALLQLFALKLLKMQAKHLGRQWRRTNMEIISSIYSKVRHRFNDDWAYGNETQSKAFDFQAEESELRSAVEAFHLRRYSHQNDASLEDGGRYGGFTEDDMKPGDYDPVSVLGQPFELTPRFQLNYRNWLNTEVYKASIDWDQLLAMNRGSVA